MPVHVIEARLGIVFDREDAGLRPEAAVRNALDDAAHRPFHAFGGGEDRFFLPGGVFDHRDDVSKIFPVDLAVCLPKVFLVKRVLLEGLPGLAAVRRLGRPGGEGPGALASRLRGGFDLALVGFDDIPLARYVYPPLTTMRVDIAELGARALSALLDAGGDAPKQDSSFMPKLMVRASSGAGTGNGRRVRSDSS